MDDDLRLYLRSLEEELQGLRGQLADLDYVISGVGPRSDTSLTTRSSQTVNLLVEIRDGLKAGRATASGVFLLLGVAFAHVLHHW